MPTTDTDLYISVLMMPSLVLLCSICFDFFALEMFLVEKFFALSASAFGISLIADDDSASLPEAHTA